MPRKLIGTTLTIWFLVALFFCALSRQPAVFLFPLYGLYPGEMTSGGSDYHPVLGHLWAAGVSLVFFALAFIGLRWNNKEAAVAFTGLFLLSFIVMFARVASVMGRIH